MSTKKLLWIPVNNYEGIYECSNTGFIKSVEGYKNNQWGKYKSPERILKPGTDRGGYLYVYLTKNGISKFELVHRLVLKSFTILGKNKIYVNHKNGIKSDNSLENLEWCTKSENTKHAYKTGLKKAIYGEFNKASKVTENQVKEIRNKYPKIKISKLALEYKVNYSTIERIVKRITWNYV